MQLTGAVRMIDGFSAKPLAIKQIDQAYALVRTVVPDLTQARWRDFAAALLDPPAGTAVRLGQPDTGIMTVQNDAGYILGLFSYRACDHLRHGHTLAVDNLIVVDLFDSAGALDALLSSMERLAQDLGCQAIHTDLPPHHESLPESCRAVLDGFREDGKATESARLIKLMGEPPCRPVRKRHAND